MNQQSIMAGIVTKVTDTEIFLDMESGGSISMPKQFGESPLVNSVLIVDSTSGTPQLYSSASIGKIRTTKRYMNFYAIEKEDNLPDTQPTSEPMKADGMDPVPVTAFNPFSFADTPSGARTLAAGNGNMVFAGPTSAGIVTSCESKMIVRDNGTAEIVTPHFQGMMGKTVFVSSLHDNLSIEIDISTVESSGGTGDINSIKNDVAKKIVGADDELAMAYEDAFKFAIAGSDNKAFLEMFGLQLAEVLLTFKWERLKYHGSEKVFNEVFGGLGVFETIYVYCQDCYGQDVVSEMEFFLQEDGSTEETASVNVPNCEDNAFGTIMGLSAFFNSDNYEVYAANMTLKDGTTIEYSKKKRIYALSHGVIAKRSWNSADKHALYADTFHANVDNIAVPDITVTPNTPGYCGNPVGVPIITWGGDFSLNVLGDAIISSNGSSTFYGGTNAIIGGGTKGILIDNSGSSATTL